MSNIKRNLVAVVAVGVSLVWAGSAAQASTAGASILVTASELSLCTVTALPLAFGNYAGTVVSSSTSLTVLCTSTTPYTIALNGGSTSGGTTSARLLYNSVAATSLGYSLYTDAAHTTPWAANTVAGTGTGLAQTVNVYGGIAAGLPITPGLYSDSVTATLTY